MLIDMQDYSGWNEWLEQFLLRPLDKSMLDRVARLYGPKKLIFADSEPILLAGAQQSSLLKWEAYIWAVAFKGLRAKHIRVLRPIFDIWAEDYNRVWAHLAPEASPKFIEAFGLTKFLETPKGSYYERVKKCL